MIAATLAALVADAFFPVASLALLFLAAVLLAAVRGGLGPSLFASVASFFAYNYFFTAPHHTFYVDSRDDVLTLALFLLVALVTGNLAARVRAQAATEHALAQRTANLYEFTRAVANLTSLSDIVGAAACHVAATLQCRTVVLLPSGPGEPLGVAGASPPGDQLASDERQTVETVWRGDGGSSAEQLGRPWLYLRLVTDQGRLGVLGVAFEPGRILMADERRLLELLADQVAVAIERARLVADVAEARVLSETERLRAALLSSITHDLRTPLVSIIGSATSLLHYDEFLAPDARRELAETIRDEGERLNRFVQNLLDMTRLGSGSLALRRDWSDLRELLGRALHQLRFALPRSRVRIAIPADVPMIDVDPVLIEQVFVNVLDNAVKHGFTETRVEISAQAAATRVVVAIADDGPGIAPADRDRIFDMFYRAQAGDGARAGSGLGLAICRGIVEAHGGTIRATAATADGLGLRIEVGLPVGDPVKSDRTEQPRYVA